MPVVSKRWATCKHCDINNKVRQHVVSITCRVWSPNGRCHSSTYTFRVRCFPAIRFIPLFDNTCQETHRCLFSIDLQPHLYAWLTSLCRASAVQFSCLVFCCHKVWTHSSTAQWTQDCQQQTLTWSNKTAGTTQPLMNIIVLRASKMLRRLKQRGLHFLFKLCACFFANTFVVFLPLVHSLAASRHLWPRRHQTTDAGQGFLFVAARSTTATTGRLNFEP